MDANQPEKENLENIADGANPNPVDSADDAQLQRLQDELNSTRDQLLRTMADFQNFRKRKQEDEARIRQYATENLVTVLLPVLDNFERTVKHLQQGASVEQMVEGISAVERQLRSALESQNVKRIATIGQPFDPNVHEAIGMTEANGDFASDTVTEEYEAGYRMGERVIRPARVKVAQ